MPSLADLSNSIFASLGMNSSNSLRLNSKGYECLVLIDGLGAEGLELAAAKFPIFGKYTSKYELQSIFPSTTVVNLTSLATGLLPNEHGMFGYTVRVPNSGNPERLLNGLKWDEKVDPEIWQDQETLFEKAKKLDIKVLHIAAKRYQETGFTRAALRGGNYFGSNRPEQMVEIAESEFNKSLNYSQKTFAYIYLNQVDAAGHEFGVESEQWWQAVQIIAEFLEQLRGKLPSKVRIWLTSDHGMINSKNHLILGENNSLLENIALIGGEPRARHLYFSPDANSDYENILAKTLSNYQNYLVGKAQIFTREQATLKLFGGIISESKKLRVGDLVVVPESDLLLLDPNRAHLEGKMVGHHGGFSETEVNISALAY